jgi:hypothetical protein
MSPEFANFRPGRKGTTQIERVNNPFFGGSSRFCGKANASILFFQYHISQVHG